MYTGGGYMDATYYRSTDIVTRTVLVCSSARLLVCSSARPFLCSSVFSSFYFSFQRMKGEEVKQQGAVEKKGERGRDEDRVNISVS